MDFYCEAFPVHLNIQHLVVCVGMCGSKKKRIDFFTLLGGLVWDW